MKKKILGLALIAMSMVALGSNAQTPSKDNGNCTQTECTQGQQGNNKAKARKGNPAQCCQQVFDKMNLSADQKAKLQALQQKKAEARKQQSEARKADKQRGDSAARAARVAEKQQFLQELKSIVGPDNYVIFLEDFYVQGNGQRQLKPAANKMAKVRKDVKAGDRKDRKDRKRPANGAPAQAIGETAQK